VAERLAQESLALPVFPELASAELDHVISALAKAVLSPDQSR
jgi:dTDP-4-amino-4,6-dideoxygalactose transaminase